MVGQENLKKFVTNIKVGEINLNSLTIIEGESLSGKTTFVKYLAKEIGYNLIITEDTKIDTIREIIKIAYKQKNKTIYYIPHIDTMSIPAKNSLLKLTEEPPKNAYIICSCENAYNTLQTLKSRASILKMELYKEKDLMEYCKNLDVNQCDLLTSVCSNIGQIKNILDKKIDVVEIYSFIEKVIENIYEVEGANAFKINKSVKLKETENGYELDLFFRVFIKLCYDKREDDTELFLNFIIITENYLKDLKIKGINKKMLFDNWILDIRGV